ncbi:hypothetical protein H312_03624, partial [Anncaliia algerae PRA339]
VYSVYERPLELMSEDFILDNVESSKKESIIKDDKISYDEIIYVADQKTTDLASQAYTEDNIKQEHKELDQNINPLINKILDNIDLKENDTVTDLRKSDTKSNNKKEEIINKEDKDNGVCLFNIVGVVVLVVLNM